MSSNPHASTLVMSECYSPGWYCAHLSGGRAVRGNFSAFDRFPFAVIRIATEQAEARPFSFVFLPNTRRQRDHKVRKIEHRKHTDSDRRILVEDSMRQEDRMKDAKDSMRGSTLGVE